MSSPSKRLRACASAVALGLTAALVRANTTEVTPQGLSTPRVDLNHGLPPAQTPDLEQLFAPDWTITLLPAGYTAQDVSRDGKIVLLAQKIAGTNFYCRWSQGNLEPLGQTASGQDNEEAWLNGTGTVALGKGNNSDSPPVNFFAKWTPADRSFQLLYSQRVISVTNYGFYGEPFVSYYGTAKLMKFDNQNRAWFFKTEYDATYPGSADKKFSLVTIDSSGVESTRFADWGNSYLAPVYSLNGISLNGSCIYESQRNYNTTSERHFYLNGIELDFIPKYISENDYVIGADFIHSGGFYSGTDAVIRFPDGHKESAINNAGRVTWVDGQNRLRGFERGTARAGVFVPRLGSNGLPLAPAQYDFLPDEFLVVPTGWATDHMVAPGTISPQLGIAVNLTTGMARPFVATRKIQLAVDANRDGTIKLASEDASDATFVNPYRFWLNDDDDSGDTSGSDIPGVANVNWLTPLNGGDMGTVQGARDLIDWFPVALDIKQLLTTLPPSSTVKYKLKQANGALNFVYTNLTRGNAFDYQRPPQGASPLTSGFGPDLTQAPTGAYKRRITADGVDLFNAPTGSTAFLDAAQNHDGGVILVEGRAATTAPLVLSVEKDGNVIAEVKLYVKLSGVEDMYRHLNLRSGPDAPDDALLVGNITRRSGDADMPTNYLTQPPNFPDTSTDQSWFIFVDGSNVGGQHSRGWESETFKRLYWSKSKARFVGVSWFGDPYFNSTEQIYDYHMAVRNSFATASKLKDKINTLSGSKTIAGHSLGCGLIAAAIADYGMTVNHTCLIDAAIAREAFDGRAAGDETSSSGVTAVVGMTLSIWQSYDPSFYAANWNERFAALQPTDARFTNLTWRNRFAAAAGTVNNFYSSTEDCLGRYDGDVPDNVVSAFLNAPSDVASYVWVYQEKAKGNRQDYYVWPSHVGSTYGGWGMNLKDPILGNDPLYWKWVSNDNYIGRLIKTPAEIGTVSDAVLRRHPVFEPGWGVIGGQQQESPVSNVSPVANAPSWIYDLCGTSGGTHAADYAKRAQLLAEFVPALSLPMGSRLVNSTTIQLSRQHNSPAEFAAPGWPRGFDSTTNVARWRHCDMREIAYVYQAKLWDTLVSISQQP